MKTIKFINFILGAILFSSLLVSCNKEDSKKDKQLQQTALLLGLSQTASTPPVLSLKEVTTGTTANLGHTQQVKIKLNSSGLVDSVPVNFYYISKEDADKLKSSGTTTLDLTTSVANKSVRAFMTDFVNIPKVSKGENEYSATLTFPSLDANKTAITSGDYYMVTKVDPMGYVQKIADTSNTIDLNSLNKVVTFSSSKANTTDLLIVESRLKEDVLRFKEAFSDIEKINGTKPVNKTELVSGTITIKSVGVKYYGAKLRFALKAPDGTSQSIKVWDTDIPGFVEDLTIAELKESGILTNRSN